MSSKIQASRKISVICTEVKNNGVASAVWRKGYALYG
jgi:hypothetical protein